MNLLILSCGTRNKLVGYFKSCDMWDKVVACDCSEYAPALYAADKYYIVPKMTSPGYFDEILSVCAQEEINAILPLQEDELILISENRAVFEAAGIFPIISSPEAVKLCRDKYALNSYLNEKGIKAVETFTAEEYLKDSIAENGSGLPIVSDLKFPVFVKPGLGAGSIDTFCVKTKVLLSALVSESDSELIVQPACKGEEYGIDLFVDFISGKAVQIFIKKKISMKAGETEKSVSVVNDKLAAFAALAVEAVGLKGPVDMDVFVDGEEFTVLEINPRFGGGYPHARECGMDVPTLIARNVKGEENTESLSYKDGVVCMKYSDIVTK